MAHQPLLHPPASSARRCPGLEQRPQFCCHPAIRRTACPASFTLPLQAVADNPATIIALDEALNCSVHVRAAFFGKSVYTDEMMICRNEGPAGWIRSRHLPPL